jgi:hypothetical protein
MNDPDIRVFSLPASGTGIRPDTGYKKTPDYSARYLASRIFGASLGDTVTRWWFKKPWS